jgi:hypothetical protein
MPMPAPLHVNASRGAPMGRCDVMEVDAEVFDKRVHLQLLPMSGYGDYDTGGAYWGCGSRKHGWMYRCYYYDQKTGESVDLYLRAVSRDQAKCVVLHELPCVKFYR